ncbi:X antigen family member 3-like [Neovison vison]|uniref:P antigen family member 3 n=1 Tax=Neovison vison TaxID=452646 RepID=UPI001CF068FC|nr:P antigen family member 3 [Neogale vison]XP_044092118.1 X antigen family member 3-like [Neogale vison]
MSRRTMSGRARSRSKPKHKEDDPGSTQRVGTQKPRDEKPKQKEAPPESQDMKPEPGKEVEAPPAAQGPDLKADLQKLPQAEAGHVTGYHPDVKGRNLPFLEPIKMPRAGEGQPQI